MIAACMSVCAQHSHVNVFIHNYHFIVSVDIYTDTREIEILVHESL